MAKLTLILLAAPLALTSLSMPAAAQEVRSVTVRHGDLNLASVEGRDRLTARVREAVRQVCSSQPRPSLQELRQQRECERVATARSDVQLASLFNNTGNALASSSEVVVAAR